MWLDAYLGLVGMAVVIAVSRAPIRRIVLTQCATKAMECFGQTVRQSERCWPHAYAPGRVLRQSMDFLCATLSVRTLEVVA